MMDTVLVWGLVALLVPPQIFGIGLALAPASFWLELDLRRSKTAGFLWGYSHPFGPRLRIGERKPWLRASSDAGE